MLRIKSEHPRVEKGKKGKKEIQVSKSSSKYMSFVR
jgi:hypothetical protein